MTEACVPWSLHSTTREATATREQLVRCNEEQSPLSATREKPVDQWKPIRAKMKEMKLYLKTKQGFVFKQGTQASVIAAPGLPRARDECIMGTL